MITLQLTFLVLAAAMQAAPRLDELAEETLSGWEKLEYRPVELGLRSGSFTVKMHLTGRGEARGLAKYSWKIDGKKRESNLSWDPESLGQRLSKEGWSKDRFDADFLHVNGRLPYRGCELIGHVAADGSAWIEIRGQSLTGVKELHFTPEGVLAKQVFEVDAGFGTKMKFTLSPRYRRTDLGTHVKTGESFEMSAPFGKIVSDSEIELHEVNGVLVPKRMQETSTWNGLPSGTNTFEYTDWKIEKAVAKEI